MCGLKLVVYSKLQRSNHYSLGMDCNFIPQFTGHVITYPCWRLKLIYVSKRGSISTVSHCFEHGQLIRLGWVNLSLKSFHWVVVVIVKCSPRNTITMYFLCLSYLIALTPRQNGRHFADDIFKCILLIGNVWIWNTFSLKVVPKVVPKGQIPALVQIMAWRRPGDKPLSEPMTVSLLAHICVTRPQWIKIPWNMITWTNV